MNRRLFLKALGGALLLPSAVLAAATKVRPKVNPLTRQFGFFPIRPRKTMLDPGVEKVMQNTMRGLAQQLVEEEARAFYS